MKKYIGLPYTQYDCWGLVRLFYADKGIPLPDVVLSAEVVNNIRTLQRAMVSPDWIELEVPEDPCVVAMSSDGKHYQHVGIYTNKGILHSVAGRGVIHQSVRAVSAVSTVRLRYYKWARS